MSPGSKTKQNEETNQTIEEVKTEDIEEADGEHANSKNGRSITPTHKFHQGVSRTTNQSSAEKDKNGPVDGVVTSNV